MTAESILTYYFYKALSPFDYERFTVIKKIDRFLLQLF